MAKEKKTKSAPKKKPGNKGDFHGAREVYLRSQLAEYFKKSKQRKTREFWAPMMDGYFELFPWRLSLNEEPDVEGGVEKEVLSPADVDLKIATVAKIKAVRGLSLHGGYLLRRPSENQVLV